MSDDLSPYALIVDDEALVRMDAAAILEDAGFRTLEAGDADTAIGLLHAHRGSITTLFTDVDMPGRMDGFELARYSAENWPEIAILVASGRRKPQPGDMPDGAVFVGKPFSAEVVIERLKQLLPNNRRPDLLREVVASGE